MFVLGRDCRWWEVAEGSAETWSRNGEILRGQGGLALFWRPLTCLLPLLPSVQGSAHSAAELAVKHLRSAVPLKHILLRCTGN